MYGTGQDFFFLIFFCFFSFAFLFDRPCMVDTMGAKDGAKVLLIFDMSDHKIVGGYSTLLAKVNKK